MIRAIVFGSLILIVSLLRALDYHSVLVMIIASSSIVITISFISATIGKFIFKKKENSHSSHSHFYRVPLSLILGLLMFFFSFDKISVLTSSDSLIRFIPDLTTWSVRLLCIGMLLSFILSFVSNRRAPIRSNPG